MNTRGQAPAIWYRWLYIVIVGVMAFGVSMILAPGLTRQFFGLLIFYSPTAITSGFSPAAVDYITLVHGVLGAVMFGWGVIMMQVLRGPFRRSSREGWNMIAVSVVAWFLPDTAFSLWTGFWQNAVLNSVFAVLFLIPLAATYKGFRDAPG